VKALVVYYSRTGVTKTVAETARAILQCDTEELVDTQRRKGFFGYVRSARQAMKRELTKLAPCRYDPSDYDVAILGTPVWVYTLSVPARTWLEENKGKVKKIALLCTHGGKDGLGSTFEDAETILGLPAVAKLDLLKKDVKQARHVEPVNEFIRKVRAGVPGEPHR
jgi:flavodoxin